MSNVPNEPPCMARGTAEVHVFANDTLAKRHLALSSDSSLPVAERYRQLAAVHAMHCDYRRAVQAMWASSISLDQFVPLESLKEAFRIQAVPLWLASSGEAASYPSCEVDDWQDVEGLAELHADISSMAISSQVKLLHGAIAYMLSGQYGFAMQSLKSSEHVVDAISLEDLASGAIAVDVQPAWLRCWD
ncbi:hypothetical protein [Ralstonia mojiangensis]|uniref:hypothetical protein n=1 Tax=Ralstonia mojiangensis TaxID=2953895 RepID=UPI0021B4B066|nr:hypothetical protein [Ralstonia mojiangensis]MCT7325020.1 hypothetical protein [Ralstonia mojiangensis]